MAKDLWVTLGKLCFVITAKNVTHRLGVAVKTVSAGGKFSRHEVSTASLRATLYTAISETTFEDTKESHFCRGRLFFAGHREIDIFGYTLFSFYREDVSRARLNIEVSICSVRRAPLDLSGIHWEANTFRGTLAARLGSTDGFQFRRLFLGIDLARRVQNPARRRGIQNEGTRRDIPFLVNDIAPSPTSASDANRDAKERVSDYILGPLCASTYANARVFVSNGGS